MADEITNETDAAMALVLSSSTVGNWQVAHVAGEIDCATAPQLRGFLQGFLTDTDVPAGLIVDLRGVDFCDASGVGVFNGVHRRAERRGFPVLLVCPEGCVRRVFRILGATHSLSLHATVEAALAAVGVTEEKLLVA
jgi:anti-sigma B factor antagonist